MQKPLPKVTVPQVPKQEYATSRPPVPRRENTYQRQAEVLKGRIQQNVDNLVDSGGTWWSPWRVMRESGATVSGLVDRRSVDEVLDAFGVDSAAIERGLQSERTLDYLANVGYDLRGKDVEGLSGREAFELLSARQIRDASQIVDILSNLTDRLADDRTAQAEDKEKERRKRKGHAMLSKPEYSPMLVVMAVAEISQVMPNEMVRSFVANTRDGPPIPLPVPL
ncbi:MAG: hypothetical protein QGG64_24370 [Candidatus Latescibacteria bacterium]|nr:hypothetical protein [Candidatus Latescibacterota bacterium]